MLRRIKIWIHLYTVTNLLQIIPESFGDINIPNILKYRLFPDLDNSVEIVPLPYVSNSTCRRVLQDKTYTIMGIQCTGVPNKKNEDLGFLNISNTLNIVKTSIIKLRENEWRTWEDMSSLYILMNRLLDEIEPRAFRRLKQLKTLEISGSPLLSSLHKDTFQGLVELRELTLLENNITTVAAITPALPSMVLPSLLFLDLSDNTIYAIEKDDFLPMKNSSLRTLRMTMTKTRYIHPEALQHLNYVEKIVFDENLLNTTVSSDFIKSFSEINSEFTTVHLSANLISGKTSFLFDTIALTPISTLDISNNRFGALCPGFFPVMSNIVSLDMSNTMIDTLLPGVINSTTFPQLEILNLSKNKLSSTIPNITLPKLTKLDISFNSDGVTYGAFQIPNDISFSMPLLQNLDLSGNHLGQIKRGTFDNVRNLTILILKKTSLYRIDDFSFQNNKKLIFLDLSYNGINSNYVLQKNIFSGLKKLKALDLTNCGISKFQDPNIFIHLRNLKYLSLRSNSLMSINSDIFKPLPFLKKLDLRSNCLLTWSAPIFINNKNLNTILLQNNMMSSITIPMLKDFQPVSTVDLRMNPLLCDCAMINNINDFYGNNIIKHIGSIGGINTCLLPEYTFIEKFYKNEKTLKQCVVSQLFLQIYLPILLVPTIAIVLYLIYYNCKWSIIYWCYVLRKKLQMLGFWKKNKKLNVPEEFKYDAFVSYSHEDRKFVNKMETILEEQFKLKLCLYHRDFHVGELILDSVLESVALSRRTILVVSDAFARSEWCLLELQIAHNKSLFLRQAAPDSLILIKLTNLDNNRISPTLNYLLKTRIYLQWDSKINKQKIFWQKLLAAIERY